MRVTMFEESGWKCEYNARRGHLFTHPDSPSILIRRGGYPGQLFVQRGWLRRVFNMRPGAYDPPAYYGLTAGGYQGGDGIDLHPRWTRETQAKLDGTIRRHHIGCFEPDGTPWKGDGKRHALAAWPQDDGYESIDGSHYIRAYSHAVAAWAHDRDPVARFWLIVCAHDVMRRFPMDPFKDSEGPEYSLGTMWANVSGMPHSGALGICRELAWSLRCVVEAQRAAPSATLQAWIERMIDMIYLGQAINGAVERHAFGQGLAQEETEARAFGISENEEWCTSWQAPFLIRAVREAMAVVPSTYSHGRTILERIKPWWANVAFAPGEDNAPAGLPRYLVVARHGIPLSEITLGFGPARPYCDADAFECFREVGV